MLIDGDRLTVSWPGRHIRDVTNIAAANRRIQKYFVDSTPAELRESFDIVSEKADDRPNTYQLTMTPKRKQIREGLSRLELWLDQTSLLLAAMRMTFPNGDTKLMVLEDVVANTPHRSRRCSPSTHRPQRHRRRDRLGGGARSYSAR